MVFLLKMMKKSYKYAVDMIMNKVKNGMFKKTIGLILNVPTRTSGRFRTESNGFEF